MAKKAKKTKPIEVATKIKTITNLSGNILSHVRSSPTIKNNLTADEKIAKIKTHFAEIMTTLGLDLSDDSLADTPKRNA